MLTYLEDGNRLVQPQFCPNEMYQRVIIETAPCFRFKIATDTWEEKAEERPTFDEVTRDGERLTLF